MFWPPQSSLATYDASLGHADGLAIDDPWRNDRAHHTAFRHAHGLAIDDSATGRRRRKGQAQQGDGKQTFHDFSLESTDILGRANRAISSIIARRLPRDIVAIALRFPDDSPVSCHFRRRPHAPDAGRFFPAPAFPTHRGAGCACPMRWRHQTARSGGRAAG